MVESVKQKQGVKQYETEEKDDWSSHVCKKGILFLLFSFENYFWCTRFECAKLFKIPINKDRESSHEEYVESKMNSTVAQFLVIVSSLFTALTVASTGGSVVVVFVSALVFCSSVVGFVLDREYLTRADEESGNDNSTDGSGGRKNTDESAEADTAKEGVLSCDGSFVCKKSVAFSALVKREARDLVNEIASSASLAVDNLAHAMFGGTTQSHSAFMYASATQEGGGIYGCDGGGIYGRTGGGIYGCDGGGIYGRTGGGIYG
jgi:nitrate reductase NapE component